MELKYYDKPWLPAFKGVFLILFGIIAMLRIFGTIKALGALFAILIAMIGILLITTGIRYKKSSFRGWTIISGVLNLAFTVYLALKVDSAKDINAAREGVSMVIFIWVIFYAVTEIIEAGLLVTMKNAFAALFMLNALLTLMFGYFLHIVTGNFTEKSVFYIGLIALVFGLVNVLSAYLLSRAKDKS